MKEIYSMKIRITLESSLMKYVQVNEAKFQKMITSKLEKLLLLMSYCHTASYIHQLLPNLIINKSSTLFLGAKQNFMNYIFTEVK